MKGSIFVTFICAVPLSLAVGQNTNKGPRYFPFGEKRNPKQGQDEANVGQENIRKRLPFAEERRPKHFPIDEANDSLQQPLVYPGSTSSRPPMPRTALKCPTLSMFGFPPSFPPSWGCI